MRNHIRKMGDKISWNVTHVGSLEICEVFASISCRRLLAADLVWWVLVMRGLFIKMRKTIDKTMQNSIWQMHNILLSNICPDTRSTNVCMNIHAYVCARLSVCVAYLTYGDGASAKGGEWSPVSSRLRLSRVPAEERSLEWWRRRVRGICKIQNTVTH